MFILRLMILILLTAPIMPGGPAPAHAGERNPVELGRVRWQRDLPQALPLAREQDKPVFVLFQEVPGCLTCQTYGHKVLSHPLIVEAIETLFIPVAVFNNKGGQDAATLKKFGEPSWNNPVVRILSPEEKDLAPRLSDDYQRSGLLRHMIASLETYGRDVPEYLRLLEEEFSARDTGSQKGTFAMFCFWSGEGMFGNLDGVVSTRPGFLDGHEVVEVEYDPQTIAFADLIQKAQRHDMAGRVYTYNEDQLPIARRAVGTAARPVPGEVRTDREPKYYMAQTALRFVPMTDLQAARVNAAVGSRADFARYLSPRQKALLAVIQRHPRAPWQNMIGTVNLSEAWQHALETAAAMGDTTE